MNNVACGTSAYCGSLFLTGGSAVPTFMPIILSCLPASPPPGLPLAPPPPPSALA
ncbi:hypothetical protein GYM54_05300 [Pseudomonas sp. MTM4]|uniref:hypothetical protein n=1 Tax=unclassified Pseudomonas TaxID=196821 RepID=UPI0018D2656A|nr:MULTISPECIES: hypothetical protein [unclassified Pseudomonas]QXY91049.1 hypothetical protein GYM54_05300 [Pseudomonas sp. MTM4]